MESNETKTTLLDRIRDLVKQYQDRHHHQTALFWADKVASLSKYETRDVYILAQCMYNCGEYERAALLIMRQNLHEKYSAFRYLAAKCYSEAKEYQQALDLLEDPSNPVQPTIKPNDKDIDQIPGIPTNKEMRASVLLLKGDLYEAKDIRSLATTCYEAALNVDVFCYEAFERLVVHHMLTPSDEQELLDSLPFSEQCKSEQERELIFFLYGMKLKKYHKPEQFEIPKSLDNLHENFEVASSLAERHYYNCEFRSSYKITSGILRTDPYHTQCLPLHIALLVVLKKSNELFFLAHKLVKQYPAKAVSWYAVGCYYLLQPKKQELTRRYLLKTTMIDKMYGPAWLALGHSFALEGEHDQAMAAFFTATQLMRGSHLPYLYIGIEYSVTNNFSLTEKFFDTASHLCPDDPHLLHEIGVAVYTTNNYQLAVKYFTKALDLLRANGEEVTSEVWEALFNNLGHCYRKLKNYDLALKFHEEALTLAPHCAQTYSSIGFILSFMGRYADALENLHKSLGLRRDDVFAVCLMEHVIEQFADTEPAIYGDDMINEEELGPPPPFINEFHTATGKSDDEEQTTNIEDDTSPSFNSSGNRAAGPVFPIVSESDDSKTSENRETPAQSAEAKPGSRVLTEEGTEIMHTPDDIAMMQSPHPVMRGTKAVTKSRWVGTSSMPTPIHFRDTPDERGIITPVLSSRKMLSIASSDSDDSALLGASAPEGCEERGSGTERLRVPSGEETWSTRVVKGGGGGFEDAPNTKSEPISVESDIRSSVSSTTFLPESQPAPDTPSVSSETSVAAKDCSDMEMEELTD